VPTDILALADDVEAAHAGGAGGRSGQRAEHVDRRALAGTVGPEEAEDLAGSDDERHVTDGFDVAVGLDEALDLDGGRWAGGVGCVAQGEPCQHAGATYR
jgi:hypothetical protein